MQILNTYADDIKRKISDESSAREAPNEEQLDHKAQAT
jgi:hypothetical protein